MRYLASVLCPEAGEADWPALARCGTRALCNPCLINQTFVQLAQQPAALVGGLDMLTEQVHVALDRGKLARALLKGRWDATELEKRMIAHQHQVALGANQPGRFLIERQ